MKIIKILLRAVLFIVTAIFGVWFNGLGGAALIYQNVVSDSGLPEEQVSHILAVGVALIAISTMCFVGGTVLVMLGKTGIAAIVSTAGLVGILLLFAPFVQINIENAEVIYMNQHMPSIFIAVVTIIIYFVDNYDRIINLWVKKEDKKHEKAPSIFDDRKD